MSVMPLLTHQPLRRPLVVAATVAVLNLPYAVLDMEPSGLLALYLRLATAVSVVWWFVLDVGGTELGQVYDLGLLCALAWPVVLPWYAFRRYRAKAWRLTVVLMGLALVPVFTLLLVIAVMVIQRLLSRRGRLTSA